MLDALVLGLGYLNLMPGASNYTADRALRVLRPLRAVSRLPKLKVRHCCVQRLSKIMARGFRTVCFGDDRHEGAGMHTWIAEAHAVLTIS